MDIFCLYESGAVSPHLDIAIESEIDGNSEAAHNHLTELFYEELKALPLETKTRQLFRFSAIPNIKDVDFVHNPLIKDIRNGSLTLSNPKKFNDPMDPILWEWLNINKDIEVEKKFRKIFKMEKNILEKNLRICCLVDPIPHRRGNSFCVQNPVENCSPLMWAHYANSHRGICIEYEISPEAIEQHNDDSHVLRLCDVRYRGQKMMSNYITLDNALLAKGQYWEYENETRLIYYTSNNTDWRNSKGGIKDYVTIDGFEIKAVYLGYRIGEKEESELRNLLYGRGIELYKMKFSRDDITRLVPQKIY